MTKEEAIKYLQQLYPNGGHCWLDEQRIEAIEMAINALQEEPVSVWHNMDEVPIKGEVIVVQTKDTFYGISVQKGGTTYKNKNKERYIRWAYASDLLNLSNVQRTVKNWNESVSEDLEEAAKEHAVERFRTTRDEFLAEKCKWSFKAGAMWQKENLWKPADGDDLPEIDREVIVLCKNGRVAFGHRPVKKFMARPIGYGRTEEVEVMTYDKGGWNIPNVVWWLDCDSPKKEEV